MSIWISTLRDYDKNSYKKYFMNNEANYLAPTLEVVELEIENAILTASGEDSIPEFGE